MTTALVLAGHGSQISPQTAGIVWQCVDQLRAWGVAEEITAAFWKELPAFSQVLATLEAEQVAVVPLFTAQGYFSKTVIPAEMGLTGAITHAHGKTIYYTPTLGSHPLIPQLVAQRITDALDQAQLDPQQVTVALIGHGTRRDPHSRTATREQVALLHQAGLGVRLTDVYLDDDPPIESIYATATTPYIVAVPFFLATGSHVTQDVPAALGLNYGTYPAQIGKHTVYYTPPIGTTDNLAQLTLELARSTGLAFPLNPTQDNWSGFPRVGRAQLWQAAQLGKRWGQLQLTPTEVKPAGDFSTPHILASPAEVRASVRENPFRPLASTHDLPYGWSVPIATPDELQAVVETIYPSLVSAWAQGAALKSHSLAEVCERQVGMFAGLQERTTPDQIQTTCQTICGNCIQHPTWHTNLRPTEAIPCLEPCNLWLSTLRKVIE